MPAVGTRMNERCAVTEVKNTATDERRANDSFISVANVRRQVNWTSRFQYPPLLSLEVIIGVSMPRSVLTVADVYQRTPRFGPLQSRGGDSHLQASATPGSRRENLSQSC